MQLILPNQIDAEIYAFQHSLCNFNTHIVSKFVHTVYNFTLMKTINGICFNKQVKFCKDFVVVKIWNLCKWRHLVDMQVALFLAGEIKS